ncbi:2-hydroxyacid dehydrogenase [Lecanosticta acicola]|uniref:2-hydroxyacid dehydrogenase n=1 Tax=Lecanosticta acicola TaxID=111012 RepID=A0AAI9EBM6_9PEZI|nr:2-hydroxyacid dehydrogenase [Lecanosticta acicola]
MAKPQVLLLGKIDHAHEKWNSLSEIAELLEPKARNREAFIAECHSGALDNVVAVYRTFGSVEITGLWDAELIRALPESVRFCAHNGAGYDQVDV